MTLHAKHFYAFGPFRLDADKRVLVRDGTPVPLAPKAAEALLVLVENAGHLVDKDDLMRRVWPDAFVEEGNLNKNIFVLRKVLGEWDGGREYIETIPKRGFRFVAPVSEVTHAEGDPEAQTSTSANLLGKKISHYRVLEIVGGGGMGLVYKAEDLKLGRRVALKFLPEELATDSLTLQRFEREARTASSLNHPNICTIYEFGEHEGQPFIVMELLEGETLRELVSKAAGAERLRLPLEKLLDISIQIADGLQAAHRTGIIHRDIKPANIFVTTHGRVKILDFGLAKLVAAASEVEAEELRGDHPHGRPAHPAGGTPIEHTLTRTGMAMGTAGYMSPEQVRGEKLDARTDLFSFGLVLYEMATGQRAFSGDTAAILKDAILNNAPIAVRELNSTAPPKLEEIINKALEKDRKHRYLTAAEMGWDLKSLRTPGDVSKKFRRSTYLLLVAALLVMAVLGWRFYPKAAHLPATDVPTPKVVSLTTEGNITEPAALSPDGKYFVCQKKSGGKSALWMQQANTGNTLKITPDISSSKIIEDVTFSPDGALVFYELRDKRTSESFLYKISALGGMPELFVSGGVGAVGFSPNGSRIAYKQRGNDGSVQLVIANANGSEHRVLYSGDKTMTREVSTAPAWSPDGKLIAISEWMPRGNGRYRTISLIDLDGHRREFTGDHQMVFGKMAWLPDGSGIVFAANPYGPEPQHIFMASYPDGRITRITHEYVAFSLKTLSLSADGNSIFALQGYDTKGFWITTGNLKHATQLPLGGAVHQGPPNSHTLIFDGLRIFYYFSTGEWDGIASYDLSSRALVRITPANLSAVDHYSLSHDGHWITFSALRNGRFGIWVAGTDGGNLRLLVDADLNEYPVFTADGKEVVFSRHGKEPGLYRIPFAGGRPTRLSDLPLGFPSSTTADGRVLCQYFDNRQSKPNIAIVSLHAGSLVRLFDWPDWNAMPRFTPDGKDISYVDDTDGTSNIWSIPVQGGPSRKLTNFTSEMIYEYDWSPDGKQLVLNRGEERSAAVLIQNFRRPTQK